MSLRPRRSPTKPPSGLTSLLSFAELFPGTNAFSDFSRGVGKLTRIDQAAGQKKCRANAY